MENWKPIYNYEGLYEISDHGRVKSLERDILKSNGVVQHRNEKILALKNSKDGYLVVSLSKNGRQKTFKVHRLVYETFMERINNFDEVDHIDFNRKNNVLENLQRISHLDNVRRSVEAGRNYTSKTDVSGCNNPNFGNRILSQRYKSDPELSRKIQSRPGSRNGRSIPVTMTDSDGYSIHFDYIRECAAYVVKNINPNISLDSAATAIRNGMLNHRMVYGCLFS